MNNRGKHIIEFLEDSIAGLHFSREELLDVLFSGEMFYPKSYRLQQTEKTI